MHKLKLILTALFLSFLCAGLRAQTRLTPTLPIGESFGGDIDYRYLQKLIDTAKKYYPEVKIRMAQTDIARTTYNRERASWLEAISVTPSYVYSPNTVSTLNASGTGTTSFFNGYQIAFSISLGSLISKPYNIHNAKQNTEIARLQQQEYNGTLEAQVKRLYFAYLAAAASYRNLTIAVQDAETNMLAVKHRFDLGTTTVTDYTAATNAQVVQNTSRLTAELNYYDARVNLEEFVGKRLEDIK